MNCKVVFSGVLPAAPETIEQHTVPSRIIQLPQAAPATTPATTPKMWTFTTKPPSAANAGLSMHAISLICGRFGVTEYAKWLICGTQNRIRRVQPAESQRSYSPYRQIGAINKPLSKTQSPESATNKPTSTPNVDFHSRLVIEAGRQVRYQPARCDQYGVPCPLFRLRVADLASPHMLSRLRVAAPRRYVEQEPRNSNVRTRRIEQLVPHVSEIDTGKPKKLPHIRQIGIPNVDFRSRTSKPGNSDVDFHNPLPDGANPAHLKMWTFAA